MLWQGRGSDFAFERRSSLAFLLANAEAKALTGLQRERVHFFQIDARRAGLPTANVIIR